MACDNRQTGALELDFTDHDMQAPATKHYDALTIAWHWITAVLVLLLWVAGQTIDWYARGTPRIPARSAHIALGVLLGIVLAIRLVWRATKGTRLPIASPGVAGRAAKGMHYLLYAQLIGMVLLGLAAVWLRGDNIFNLFTVPAFEPGNKALADSAVAVHGLGANMLLVFASLHAVAAILHHVVVKDGLLLRMWPRVQRRPQVDHHP